MIIGNNRNKNRICEWIVHRSCPEILKSILTAVMFCPFFVLMNHLEILDIVQIQKLL